MESTWQKISSSISRKIPEHSYKMWIEPLSVKQWEEDEWIIVCPNFFSKKRVQDYYGDLLLEEIRRHAGDKCRLALVVDEKPQATKQTDHHQLTLPNMAPGLSGGCMLRKDFTFDQFVVGRNNGFAYAAALSLASQKKSQQNALFLLSNTGLGKSHLSQAVGNHILGHNPAESIYYTTAEDFSNEMVYAFKRDTIKEFKEKYRSKCNVLLLEDIHHLSGKDRTQHELAGTLDSLFNAGKKIIFSSCCLPGDIPKLNDKLRSRLSCGLISMIEPPDFRTRLRILKKRSSSNGYEMPEDVLNYLASELTEDIRQLKNGLLGVVTKASLMGSPINLRLAESVVSTMVRYRRSITVETIKSLVCKHYSLSIKDLVSRSRKKSIVRPRQIAIYLTRQYTDQPLQEIGRSFNRYHATALHSIGAVEKELKKNTRMKQEVEYLRDLLDAGRA